MNNFFQLTITNASLDSLHIIPRINPNNSQILSTWERGVSGRVNGIAGIVRRMAKSKKDVKI